MRTTTRLALAACVAVALLGGAAAPAAQAQGPEGRARRVLLVSLPRLTWADVDELRPPALLGLMERGAAASLSVRTIGPRTSLGEGYVTTGAGNRATAEDTFAGLALARDSAYEGGLAGDVFRRRTGVDATGEIVHLGVARVQASNDRLSYGAEPGTLGQALAEAGIGTGVVGNADVAPSGADIAYHREAALAVMDGSGQVAVGAVERDLVVADDDWPFGLRLDGGAVLDGLDQALGGAGVVLLEASDLDRVDAYAAFATPRARRENRRQAVLAADRLLASALERVDLERDLVLVLSPAAPRSGESLTVFAMAGPGVEPGRARSGTTRRDGFVTLPDVAPTVLDAVGVDAPDSMTGTEITSDGSGAQGLGDVSHFVGVNELTLFRDDVTAPASTMFVVFQVLVYALAALAVSGRRDRPRLRRLVGLLALTSLAMPLVAFALGMGRYDSLRLGGVLAAMILGGAALGAAALAVTRRRPLLAPVLLVGVSLAVLLGDVATGGRLQLNTVFGYSPIVAGRFAGYGNLAFAVVAMSAIVVASGVWGAAAGAPVRPSGPGPSAAARRPGRGWLIAIGAGLAAVVVADGHPSLGSDVGGVLATVPAFAVLVLLLAGVRLGWRRAVAIGAATVAVVAAFAALDLSRPASEQTHLGRLISRAAGDGDGVLTILQRKAEANVGILSTTVWTYVIPFALAFLVFLTWRPQGFMRRLLDSVPGLRACLVAGLVAGVLGFALNDSGVAVPAMMLGVLLPYVTFLLVSTEPA